MKTENAIRQSEFAESHHLTAGAVAALRNEHLEGGEDFWSEGRAIFWTAEAAAKIEVIIAHADEPEEPEAIPEKVKDKPDTLQVRITRRARNYQFVYAGLDGLRIAVKVPKNMRESIIGKTVTVARSKDAQGTVIYTLVP